METIDIATWLYNLLFVIYVVTIIGTVVVVLSENRNPLKSIAWVIVLLFLPIVGLIFYFFLGRDFRRMRLISRKSYKRINQYTHAHQESKRLLRLSSLSDNEVNLIYQVNHAKLFVGNSVEVLTTGSDFFSSLFEVIRGAQSFIHLQFYIIERDKIGAELIELLIAKVCQGVEVRVIYDDVGSWGLKAADIEYMRENGIEVMGFLEVRFPAFADKINYRNHRKLVVVDGKVGYIGGMNVADRYLRGVEWGIWRDTQLRIEGPAVQGLQASFSTDWYFCTRRLLWDAHYFPLNMIKGDVAMQIVTSGPVGQWREIMIAIFKAISVAQRYVYIQTPYFLPTESFLLAFQAAALSNVDVRLMLPARSDSYMVHIGSCSYIDAVLKAGVKVYQYQPGFLHAKMVIIDDEISTVGSANMDFRSFEHNFEANAFMYDPAMAKKLKGVFLRDQQSCKRLTLRKWRSRPLRQKALESVVRLFSPLL